MKSTHDEELQGGKKINKLQFKRVRNQACYSLIGVLFIVYAHTYNHRFEHA